MPFKKSIKIWLIRNRTISYALISGTWRADFWGLITPKSPQGVSFFFIFLSSSKGWGHAGKVEM